MSYSDNIDAVLRDMEGFVPSRNHTLNLANNREYARYLHDKAGFYVFSDERLRNDVVEWIRKVIDAGIPLNDENAINALDAAGFQYVDFLQSLTLEMRPPVKKGEGPRRAHPGHWADITRNLANSYVHDVDGKNRKGHTYG